MLDNNNNQLMMSDALKDAFEDFDPASIEYVKQHSKPIVVKFTNKQQNDVLICVLKGCGITFGKEQTLELIVDTEKAIKFYYDFSKDNIQIFGIDMLNPCDTKVQYDLLPEKTVPYKCTKCNIYDVAIQQEECTLVLIFESNKDV